jgi:four helix bundle protein
MIKRKGRGLKKFRMNENIIKVKSYSFAVRVVLFSRELRNRKVEAVIINQLLKSGTSVAANVEEAVASISKREFSAKISISYKEGKESLFWLRILHDTGTISTSEFSSLSNDLDEILKILFCILKKTRMSNEQ